MIIVIDQGNHIYLFENKNNAEKYLEILDILESEYEIMDEYGQIYKSEIISQPKFFSQGSFRLIPSKIYNKSKIISIIEHGEEISPTIENINTVGKLREYVLKCLSASDLEEHS